MDDNKNYFFLQGDGECVKLARSVNWAETPISDPSQWPMSLKNAVAVLFSSEFPMFLWWGEKLTQFYNDAYRPSLGNEGKHPKAMGQSGYECWPEIWDFIYPLIEQVLTTGKGVYYEDHYLPIYRNGAMEDVYWTFSYSPVRNDEGVIEGVLVVCNETTDKNLSLQRLTESKRELEFAVEAAELGTWDLNPLTGKFSANHRLKKWFGLQPDDHMPLGLAIERIAEKDRQNVEAAIGRALEPDSGGKYNIIYTIINPETNKDRVVLAKGQAWFGSDDRAYRFNGTLQDITASIKADQDIAESRKLTDMTVKNIGMGLFRVDVSDDAIEYTPEFAGIITGNKERKDLSRTLFKKYLHPEDNHLRSSAIKDGIESGEFFYTPRVVWDDGSVRRVAILGARILDDSGRIAAFSGTVRDITVHDNHRLALEEVEMRRIIEKREGEAFFRNVTNSSPTGLWLANPEGNLTYLNKTLVDWTGMEYIDLLGAGWANSIIEHDRQRATGVFAEALSRRAHYDVQFRMKKHDGSVIWCRAAGDPYYSESGEYAGYAGYCMDMDEIIAGRKAIADREVLFRSIIEQAPVATCLFVGKDMRVDISNDIMLAYWGKDRSVIGVPLRQALPELIGQPFLDILDKVFTTGIPHTEKGAKADLVSEGKIRTGYFDYTYKPLRTADGEIYGVMNMSVDVTQQVIAQQQIEEQQQRMLASFEEAPVGIATIDMENLTFRMANSFYGALVGRKPGDIIDKPLLEAIPELKGQGFDDLLRQVISTGIAYTAKEVSAKLVRNDMLETIYVDLTYQPRRDTDDAVTGILVVATEVTQQVFARKRIEDAQHALHNAIELAELSTWKLDIKNNVFIYSRRFMDWLGFAEDTKDIDAAYNPLPDEYRESVPAAVNAVLQQGSSGLYDNEHPIINRVTGQVRIIHANAQVFYDSDGNPEFLSGTAQDVTKERKLQQELEFKVNQRTAELSNANTELAAAIQAMEINNQELQQFAYIASHDLQEPIRKIAVFMQLLENNLHDVSPKAQGYIERINSSASRMSNLVRDVLGFSQLSGGTEKFSEVNLSDIFKEIVSEYEITIAQNHAEVSCSDLPVIEAIPLQMSQLFGNMISNSLKYFRGNVRPKITVTAGILTASEKQQLSLPIEAEYYRLEFSDNGIGFEQEYAEKIFNIFQRLHGKDEFAGTGIGLAMCRKIVQNHNGLIKAHSDGEGAVFTVILPSVQAMS